MFWKRKRDVLVTNDVQWYGRALQALKDENIDYSVKTVDTGSRNGGRGRMGENLKLSAYYHIRVSEDDEERASYLIHKCKRG